LTSSQSRLRDGIPTLASRVSCFVGGCLLRCHPYLVLRRLHRHLPFRKPCGRCSVVPVIVRHGSRLTDRVDRAGSLMQHACIFTHRADRWNPAKCSFIVKVLEQAYQSEARKSSQSTLQADLVGRTHPYLNQGTALSSHPLKGEKSSRAGLIKPKASRATHHLGVR
jgi:hypothetical protein